MTAIVSLDRAGRIVLPKPLRDQLNLHAGSQLELSTREDRLELKPLDVTPAFHQQDGMWIHQERATTPLADAIRRGRDERLDHLARPVTR